MTRGKQTIKSILLIAAVVAIFVGAISLSQWLSNSSQAVSLIENAGYLGLVFVGLVSGLNFIVPIPAATFSTLYSAAGLATVGIVLALALGTLIADIIGFWFGAKARSLLEEKYPKIVAHAKNVATNHRLFIFPFVVLYAALVPFPNEAILIPLALTGIRLRFLLLPLIIGDVLHQAILIFGIEVFSQLLNKDLIGFYF